MKKDGSLTVFVPVLFFFLSLSSVGSSQSPALRNKTSFNAKGQPVYRDIPYLQDYSIKYYLDTSAPPSSGSSPSLGSSSFSGLPSSSLSSSSFGCLSINRDGQIRVLSTEGLLVPDNGSLFYAGRFTPDISYAPIIPKKIVAIGTYQNQTFYLDNKQLFSNAWAGKIQIDHGLSGARLFAGGDDFHFLVSDGDSLVYLDTAGTRVATASFANAAQIRFLDSNHHFLLVSPNTVAEWVPGEAIRDLYHGSGITCAIRSNGKIFIGTTNGYLSLQDGALINKLPCPHITDIEEIEGRLWFGSARGAYCLNADGKYSYYAGERWLPGNQVLQIAAGPDNSILVLTEKGLGQICFKKMTLEDKAFFYEKQVREKNIRYGINCSVVRLKESYASAQTANQPSDNLWTGMYLVSQLYRYKVTGSKEARENAYESFEALERLHTVTGIKGLFARSFERDYKLENAKEPGWQQKELKSGAPASLWLSAADHHNWTWRSTASSDQTVGQIFALTAILELIDEPSWKKRALNCLDNLMEYIVENNLYIIDVDGQPTMWGKWNPDYVNSFPKNVGDRKITSSNIIAFLQTAYHFTHNDKYKKKAYELIEKFGYLENLMRPMSQIGPDNKDELSQALSHEWNHSDDEMYFLAYWGLYPYAFTPALKEKFRDAIKDHWNIERPEQDALWNLTYAMTGARDFDLVPSIRYFKNYPMDLRNWAVHNSQRSDLELLPKNFRGQTTRKILPLGELPLCRHNGQPFRLDAEGDGKSLISAGDTWLLPYWMGRYLGVISAPLRD